MINHPRMLYDGLAMQAAARAAAEARRIRAAPHLRDRHERDAARAQLSGTFLLALALGCRSTQSRFDPSALSPMGTCPQLPYQLYDNASFFLRLRRPLAIVSHVPARELPRSFRGVQDIRVSFLPASIRSWIADGCRVGIAMWAEADEWDVIDDLTRYAELKAKETK